MHIHPEGVEVLKWFGIAALIIVLFVVRFSDILPNVYGSLLERATTRFPARKRVRGKRFKVSYKTKVRQRIAFWALCSVIVAFLLLEWFVVPQVDRMDRTLVLPLACMVFAAGSVVIGLGPVPDQHGTRWQRWPFWVTVVATAITVFLIARLLNPQTPPGVFAVLVLSLLPFAWILSFMDYVDQRLAETAEMGVTKDYDGSTPLHLPSRRK